MQSRIYLLALTTMLACGKDSSGPALADCALRLQLQPSPALFVGRSAPLHARVSALSGNCNAPAKLPSQVTWTSARPDIVQVNSPGDTTATAIAKAVGTATITAALTAQPSVRDSIDVSVAVQASVVPRVLR